MKHYPLACFDPIRVRRAAFAFWLAMLLVNTCDLTSAGEVFLESGPVLVDSFPSVAIHESPIGESGRFPEQATVQLLSRFIGGRTYYTLDGSLPTTASSRYDGAFTVTRNTVLRQLAVSADGSEQTLVPPVQIQIVLDGGAYTAGEVTSKDSAVDTYTLLIAHESPLQGTGRFPERATVQLTSRFPGGKVFYTLDGSTPTTASPEYTGAFSIDRNLVVRQLSLSADGSEQVQVPPVEIHVVLDSNPYAAMAVNASATTVDTYPTLKVNGRDFSGELRVLAPVQVALASRFSGGKIYYTLDGSVPTTSSARYTDPFLLTQHAVIRQLVVSADGTATLSVASSEILPVDDDRHFPSSEGSNPVRVDAYPGLIANGKEVDDHIRVGDRAEVQLLSRFPGGTIFYTLDGTEPTQASSRYVGPFVVTQNVTIRQKGWSVDSLETTSVLPILVDIFPEFVDAEVPVLTLTEPMAGPAVMDRFQIRGNANDNVGVVQVRWSWNGQDRGLLTLQGGRFAVEGLTLNSGTNVFQIQAWDSAGNVGQLVREVVWTPVLLQVGNVVDVPQGQRLVLEVTAGVGAEVLLESTTDLNAWAEGQRITGLGSGKPVRVELVQKPNENSRFWRVRVP